MTSSPISPLDRNPPVHARSRHTRPQSRLASSLADWISDEIKRRQTPARADDLLLAITFQPGRVVSRTPDFELSDIREAKLLQFFSATMDRRHLGYGDRFISLKKHRPWYVLVGQPGTGGAHYHGVVSVPVDKVAAFKTRAPWVWENLTNGGSLDIQDLLDVGWLDYVTRHVGSTPQIVAWHSIP